MLFELLPPVKTLFLFLLSCLPCLAQFGVEQPMFQLWSTAPAIDNPTNISPRMFRWWVHTDVPSNVVISNQWQDRIVGENMWQMNTAISPTNSVKGARFNGSQYLTNATTTPYDIGVIAGAGSSGDVFYWVHIHESVAGFKGLFATVSSPYGPYQNAGDLQYGGSVSGGPNTIASITANVTNDVILVLNGSGSSWSNVWYINGISVKTNTSASVDDFTYKTMGRSSLGFFTGYIKENGIYTNVAWTQTHTDKLHKWLTNYYGVYP